MRDFFVGFPVDICREYMCMAVIDVNVSARVESYNVCVSVPGLLWVDNIPCTLYLATPLCQLLVSSPRAICIYSVRIMQLYSYSLHVTCNFLCISLA